jgi:hypothetical protein
LLPRWLAFFTHVFWLPLCVIGHGTSAYILFLRRGEQVRAAHQGRRLRRQLQLLITQWYVNAMHSFEQRQFSSDGAAIIVRHGKKTRRRERQGLLGE